MAEFQEGFVNQGKPIEDLFKLVDTFNECVFFLGTAAAVSTTDASFRKVADGIRQQMDQYIFELQTEARRLGAGKIPPVTSNIRVRGTTGTAEPERLYLKCRLSVQKALAQFRRILKLPLTAHARAMVLRQYSQVQEAGKLLAAVHRAA
jgi:hypothetical protein